MSYKAIQFFRFLALIFFQIFSLFFALLLKYFSWASPNKKPIGFNFSELSKTTFSEAVSGNAKIIPGIPHNIENKIIDKIEAKTFNETLDPVIFGVIKFPSKN